MTTGRDDSVAERKINWSPAIIGILGTLNSNNIRDFGVFGEFPTGVMIPVLKKVTNGRISPNNYRPLIISYVLSKLFEALRFPSISDNKMHHMVLAY